eukprot:scaffold897_cov402-Prasinococcus_capsulatus_cf.AAC.14
MDENRHRRVHVNELINRHGWLNSVIKDRQQLQRIELGEETSQASQLLKANSEMFGRWYSQPNHARLYTSNIGIVLDRGWD